MSAQSVISLIPSAEQLDVHNMYMAALVENTGGLHFNSWATIQGLVRAGLHKRLFDKYSQFTVDRVSSVSATTDGAGLTVSVDMDAFELAMGEAINGAYEFTYDGAAWIYNDHAVELINYGITLTGTPAEGNHIVIHETAAEVLYDVLGCDYDIPADSNYVHSLTICVLDVVNYSVLAYKKPQALFYVDPAVYPTGLAAGTAYSITLLNGAYNASTSEDGTFKFTPAVAVPAGGAVGHTYMGTYQSSSSAYEKAEVLAGKFITYDTIANNRAVIENNLETTEDTDNSATNLGTASAEDITKCTANMNLTRRLRYGTNCYFDSDERMWMNSDGAALANWFEFKTVFDLPATAAIAGYLHGIDPALVRVLGKVRKRTYLHSADRSDPAVKYRDSEELVFPLSMTEVFGSANDGVYETPVDTSGNAKTVCYPYYEGLTDAERRKYQNGVARNWWLRSAGPSYASYVRTVYSSGALLSYGANSTRGPVPACVIV